MSYLNMIDDIVVGSTNNIKTLLENIEKLSYPELSATGATMFSPDTVSITGLDNTYYSWSPRHRVGTNDYLKDLVELFDSLGVAYGWKEFLVEPEELKISGAEELFNTLPPNDLMHVGIVRGQGNKAIANIFRTKDKVLNLQMGTEVFRYTEKQVVDKALGGK